MPAPPVQKVETATPAVSPSPSVRKRSAKPASLRRTLAKAKQAPKPSPETPAPLAREEPKPARVRRKATPPTRVAEPPPLPVASPKARSTRAKEEPAPAAPAKAARVRRVTKPVVAAKPSTRKPVRRPKAPPAPEPAKPAAAIKQAVPTTIPKPLPTRPAAQAPGAGAKEHKPKSSYPPVRPESLPFKVPSVLFEGDEPVAPPVSGPGQKYLVSPMPQGQIPAAAESELPEIHGTGELYLTPRDPHCLYAHWDITAAQQSHYNTLSAHHHLLVRIRADRPTGQLVSEIHVHPESRHWFIHVPHAGSTYVAELGYHTQDGLWRKIAVSPAVATPPDSVSEDRSVQFVTIPPDVPLAAHFAGVTGEMRSPEPAQAAKPSMPPAPPLLAPGAGRPVVPGQEPSTHWTVSRVSQPADFTGLGMERAPESPRGRVPAPGPQAERFEPVWTPLQERLLEEIVSETFVRQEWIGSIELAELVRQQARRPIPAAGELASLAAAQLEVPTSPGAEYISSPGAPLAEVSPAPAPGKSFWFKVNAELVIYGSTEPDATVTIGGRRIRLRSDGTFSYRFALPDGVYELPIKAVATHGEQREAALKFYRGTEYSGEVGTHPQDPALKKPAPENVS